MSPKSIGIIAILLYIKDGPWWSLSKQNLRLKKKKQDYRLFRDGSATEGPADEDPAIPVTLGWSGCQPGWLHPNPRTI